MQHKIIIIIVYKKSKKSSTYVYLLLLLKLLLLFIYLCLVKPISNIKRGKKKTNDNNSINNKFNVFFFK